MKKALHYFVLAAIEGDVDARNNLGVSEKRAGNTNKAIKHWTIAARGGDTNSLQNIKLLFTNGLATKDDYTKALQAYQIYLSEIRSEQRDKAAAARDDYKYY